MSMFAQQIEVVSQSNNSIENVYVFNRTGTITFFCKENGTFNLDSLSAKNDSLYFQHPSYHTARRSISSLIDEPIVILQRKVLQLDAFVVSAMKDNNKIEEIPNQVEVLNKQDILNANIASAADLLQQTGNVFVQKSQLGGGSPVLRGLEANRILLSLDGVRLNNAIYRGGHTQNIITIDPFLLERTEVIFGPGSALYGSDALGGVVHLYTRQPKFAPSDTDLIDYNSQIRLGTANSESAFHLDFSYRNKKSVWLTSITAIDYGNTLAGSWHAKGYENHGLLPYYYNNINNTDSTVTNSNPYLQHGTSFNMRYLTQKINYQLSPNSIIRFNMQYAYSDSIPRFDRLNDFNNGQMVYATWNYNPQIRSFASVEFQNTRIRRFSDQIKFNISIQKINEGRETREFRSDFKRVREEEVNVVSMNLDLTKNKPKTTFYYGLEAYRNLVYSRAQMVNIKNNSTGPAATRYPDGGSRISSLGFYGITNTKLKEQLLLQTSLRYTYNQLESNFISKEFYPLPFDQIAFSNQAITGGLALKHDFKNKLFTHLNLSNAFRNPNIDDVAKVFDSEPGIVIVPNRNLNAEKAYSAELKFSYKHKEKWRLDWSNFYTIIDDIIEDIPTMFNNSDSIEYDGELSKVYTQDNTGQGRILGTSLGLKYIINHKLALNSNINYTYGRNRITSNPLAHIPPTFGKTTVIYKYKKLRMEFWAMYNGWKRLNDYSNDSADRLSEATKDGTPAWSTLNFKIQSTISKSVQIITSFENILDRNYKPFSSGPVAPGRNLILTLRISN